MDGESQPNVDNLVKLANLAQDLSRQDEIQKLLKDIPNHPWYADILQELDSSIKTISSESDYAFSYRNFLTKLVLVFQRGKWFASEKDKFRMAFIRSWTNIGATFSIGKS